MEFTSLRTTRVTNEISTNYFNIKFPNMWIIQFELYFITQNMKMFNIRFFSIHQFIWSFRHELTRNLI